MNDPDFEIRYHRMAIRGLEGQHFVVAKLRRVSSPPVEVGTVSDPQASALGRLADIIRLGRSSRNYADLKAIDWLLQEQWQTTAETDWSAYVEVVCRTLGITHLEPIVVRPAFSANGQASTLTATFHEGEMNDRPYVIARVGSIMGSPAPFYLVHPHEQQSALARLYDIFKVGVAGQAFRDFVESGQKLGKEMAEVTAEWRALERWGRSLKI